MKMQFKLVTSLLGALLAVSLPFTEANAALVITQSNTAPEDVWLQVGTESTGNSAAIYYSSSSTSASWHRDLGQTFSTGGTSISLSSFTLQIFGGTPGTEAQGAAITLSLYEFPSATASEPTGAAFYTATGFLPTGITNNNYLTFTLDNAVTLDANKTYGVVFGFSNEGTANSQTSGQWLPFGTNTGMYSGGRAVFHATTAAGDPAQSWSSATNADFFFFIGAAAVPEPKINVLISMGIALLLYRRWRSIALSRKTAC